jgi:hypothetical protein
MPIDQAQPSSPTLSEDLQEVQGIFPSDATLQDAVGRLTRSGFDRAAISLPEASPRAADATPSGGAQDPNTEDDMRQSRTLQSSMAATVAGMVGAGVTIATGGAALVAAAAAAGLGVAAGGAVSAAHTAMDASQSRDRDAAAAAGQLVLSVSASDPDAEMKATMAMQAAGATQVKTVVRTGGALT